MGITVDQWRASIGMFIKVRVRSRHKLFNIKSSLLNSLLQLYIFCLYLINMLVDIALLCTVSLISLTAATAAKHFKSQPFSLCLNLWWLTFIILLSGDIHENPGPQLKFLQWNVNSISTENYLRKTLIEAYNVSNKYDLISITETGLHSDTSNDDLQLEGYSLYRRDLPADRNYGGVMVYVSESIASQERRDSETFPVLRYISM